MPSPPRRRPATRKGRPVLSSEIIATKALEMAGKQGFRAITMRSLAGELDVTVRALYNYVEDRQQVVDLAVSLMMDAWNLPAMNPDTWDADVAGYARSLRNLYRRWPRALLIAIDEDMPPTSIHPNRLINLNRFLQLLRDIGLSISVALDVHRHLSLLVSSFALLVDHRSDQAAARAASHAPLVLDTWLQDHADLDVPILREAAALPTPSVDDQFESLIAAVTARIRSHLESQRV